MSKNGKVSQTKVKDIKQIDEILTKAFEVLKSNLEVVTASDGDSFLGIADADPREFNKAKQNAMWALRIIDVLLARKIDMLKITGDFDKTVEIKFSDKLLEVLKK